MTNHDDWPPTNWSPILIEIGRIVFNWNTLELSIKRILNHLIGVSHLTSILTIQIANRSVCDAIRTITNEFYGGEEKEHLLHLIELFDRAREYRNYYLHSFNGITVDFISLNIDGSPITVADIDKSIACMEGHSARSRLVKHSEMVNPQTVRDVARMLKSANDYTALVSLHFMYPNIHNLPQEKLSLPARLKKPIENLLDD